MKSADYQDRLLTLTTIARGMTCLPLDEMAAYVEELEALPDLPDEMVAACAYAGRMIAAGKFLADETCRGAGL